MGQRRNINLRILNDFDSSSLKEVEKLDGKNGIKGDYVNP